jgi:hypothetical protein
MPSMHVRNFRKYDGVGECPVSQVGSLVLELCTTLNLVKVRFKSYQLGLVKVLMCLHLAAKMLDILHRRV